MKFTSTLAVLFTLAAVGIATPTPETPETTPVEALPTDAAVIFSAYKGCSGNRADEDKCSGKKLGPQNSFHNCKNRDGKCCAKNKDGSGGLDASRGQGREDCGFCFTGKCKA